MPRQDHEEEDPGPPPPGFTTRTKANRNEGAGHGRGGSDAEETEAECDPDVEKQFDESTGKMRNFQIAQIDNVKSMHSAMTFMGFNETRARTGTALKPVPWCCVSDEGMA